MIKDNTIKRNKILFSFYKSIYNFLIYNYIYN